MGCVELTILTIMNLLICFTLGPVSSFATLKVGTFCFLFSVSYCWFLQASLRVESGAELTEHVLGLVLGLGHHAAAHIGVVREGEVSVLQTAGVARKHLDHVLRLHILVDDHMRRRGQEGHVLRLGLAGLHQPLDLELLGSLHEGGEVGLADAGLAQVDELHDGAEVLCSAVKRSIGFTIGFHNHGEGPY